MSETIDFGIDLGTTNSSVACSRKGEVRIFQSAEQMNVTPSVVHISRTGRMLVGKRAYDAWVADPQNTQAEFKRWMGLSDQINFPACGRTLAAEELSAEVLKALRADVARTTGEDVNAAVITVPAAFGNLQCEATARAAKMAGLLQTPLLQEPIAAAIAYGASANSRNQRWMIFDLGGGTLDIAVVSTRNGRLAVLEHQGNNRLGGKDIDRIIADTFFLAPLAATFSLPDRDTNPQAFERLHRMLVRQAEQAKIALSTAATVPVELFDLGDDLAGKPIEMTLTLSQADVDREIEPLIAKCLELAHRALEGARLSKADLDRVLLVGGPTQMPMLREALRQSLDAKLDFSLDPLTVVARGAAFYASTQERTVGPSSTAVPATPPIAGAVKLKLSYERASGTHQSPVAGKIDPASGVTDVQITAEGNYWISGWIPVIRGTFQTDVMLQDGRSMTNFTITGRDKAGRNVRLDPGTFSIAYMLPMAAPPLPHTIAIELSTTHGVAAFDPVFKRHCPLPAEVRKTYRADRTLRPSDFEATLPIKFWEIEVSDDPQERWWAGSVHIQSDKILRPILEGSELELTIKIDASRKLTAEVFVPLLNQSFGHEVYVPDPPTASTQLEREVDLCFARLKRINTDIYATDRADLAPQANALQAKVEAIYEQAKAAESTRDPDASLTPTIALRKIRVQLAQLEEQLETGQASELARKIAADARWTQHVVIEHGTDADRAECARLQQQLEKYTEQDDPRGLKYVEEQMTRLRANILHDKPSHWQNILAYLQSPGRRFMNKEKAAMLLAKAQKAHEAGDLPQMREALSSAWQLQPPDQIEASREQAAQSGLRNS